MTATVQDMTGVEFTKLGNGSLVGGADHPANGHAPADDVPDFEEAGDFEGDGAAIASTDIIAAVEADTTADAELAQQTEEPVVTSRTLYFVRIPRPVMDETAVKRAQAEFTTALTKLKKLNVKLGSKRVEVQELRKQKAVGRSLKDGSRDEYEQKLAQLKEMSDVRKSYSTRISDIKGNISGLDVRSLEELNARVKELEGRIAHDNLTLHEEKEIVKTIAKLNQQRPRVKEYSTHTESLADLQSENTKVRASISEVESEFHILKSEREQAQKIINEIQTKLTVAERELKDIEEEQAELVKAKNEAAEAITTAKQGNDATSANWRENRKLSAQVRDMVEAGQVDEARALCEQQVEVWVGRLINDAAYRKEYTALWAQQRKYAVSELLPQSATSAEAMAARAGAAVREGARSAAGKASAALRPVFNGAEKAKALIASLLQEASAEVTALAQGRLLSRPPGGHSGDDNEDEDEVAAASVPTVKKVEAFRPSATSSMKSSAATAPVAARAGPAVPAVQMPQVPDDEPFVAPALVKAELALSEAELKERVREEQRLKAAEAEERKRKKAEATEKKRLLALDSKKRAEEAARLAKLAPPLTQEPFAPLEPEFAVASEVHESAEAAPAPVQRINKAPKPRVNPVLATQKVAAAKRPKQVAAKQQVLDWVQRNQLLLLGAGLGAVFLLIVWVLIRLFST